MEQKRRWTPIKEWADKIRPMILAGKSNSEMAEEFGVSVGYMSTIKQRAVRAGLLPDSALKGTNVKSHKRTRWNGAEIGRPSYTTLQVIPDDMVEMILKELPDDVTVSEFLVAMAVDQWFDMQDEAAQ